MTPVSSRAWATRTTDLSQPSMAAHTKVNLAPGFVLHRRPYRDTSLLIEAFCPEHGRVGLVARGAGSGRSRRAALLQPFSPLLLSWSGRGELATLSGVEADGAPITLSGGTLYSGFYLNELLTRLLQRHDPHPQLFAVYRLALQQLAGGDDAEWALRLFERELLQELGYGLMLLEDAQGTAIDPERAYCYHLEHGPLPRFNEGQRCLRIDGRSLLALAGRGCEADRRDAAVLSDCKRLMRAALRLYLGEKPLASRELFRRSPFAGGGQRENEE